MGYDSAFPRSHYDRVADNEWTRLTRSRRGELNFLVHMDVLRRHIAADMDVLEVVADQYLGALHGCRPGGDGKDWHR